jgi:hypothetical protein
MPGPIETISRALSSFRGDVEAGAIDGVRIPDLDKASEWLSMQVACRIQFQRDLAAAHAQPHSHEIRGQEVGHHTLYAMAAAGHAEDDVTCGLMRGHEPHRWAEDDQVWWWCKGRDHKGNPMHEAPEVILVLDRLAETFREDRVPAYHQVRAIAHALGWHLSGCTRGLRPAPEGPDY